jgi:hypothetical protein
MKKRGIGEKSFLKKKIGSRPGRPGHESTHRVNRVLPGCCIGRSFNKPGPVQPLGPG